MAHFFIRINLARKIVTSPGLSGRSDHWQASVRIQTAVSSSILLNDTTFFSYASYSKCHHLLRFSNKNVEVSAPTKQLNKCFSWNDNDSLPVLVSSVISRYARLPEEACHVHSHFYSGFFGAMIFLFVNRAKVLLPPTGIWRLSCLLQGQIHSLLNMTSNSYL